MKFTNIKKTLRKQVEDRSKYLWTYDEKKQSFTQIYKGYSDKLQIYTPDQLLKRLQEIIENEPQ